MKKILTVLMVLCTILCGQVMAAQSAEEGYWYDDSVSNVISAGLLSSGVDLFAPEENVTAKDLVATAARLNNLYKGSGVDLPADWNFATYYTNYLSANGLDNGVTVAGEDQEMTRAEVVTILYNAVKDYADLTAINECDDIADCDTNASYYTAALCFTKAGIVAGFDEYGSFMPTYPVKRYELCVMLDRILNVNERVEEDYIVYTSDEPIFLIHDDGGGSAAGIKFETSGWRMDYTGSDEIGTRDSYNTNLYDYSKTDNMKLSRKIHVQNDGKLTFDAVYSVKTGNELYFDFLDSDGDLLLRAGWDNGVAVIEGKDNVVVSDVTLANTKETVYDGDKAYVSNRVSTKIQLDLDAKTAEMWMGTNYCGKVNLKDDFKNFAEVEIYTGVEEVVLVDIKNVHLYKNYLVNDRFIVEQQGKAPIGYTTSQGVGIEKIYSASLGQGDYNSVKVTATAQKTSYAKKSFDKTGGKVVIESYILLDDTVNAGYDGEVAFTAYSADVPVLSVKTSNDAWYADKTKLRDIDPEIWQRIRIEADTSTQTAMIRVNGKKVAENVPFLVKADGFDAVEVSYAANADSVIWFDDIEVFETFDYNASSDADNRYVPVPVPLDTGDYILNMSVCSLWRNGRHYGWDWISSFPELEPAIGFYDEGNPEVADWEIKYLVEHGIKNQMMCWYPTKGNAPIKNAPYVYHALNDGFFNAKYSDMMTFSLMFENSGYVKGCLDDFKNYVFPYWMDVYFKDPRYCKITKDDGKKYLFLNTYQITYWLQMCAGTDDSVYTDGKVTDAAAQASLDVIAWMNEQVKSAGIAEGILMCFGGGVSHSSVSYENISKVGGEASIFYTFGRTSNDPVVQKDYFATNTYKAAQNAGTEVEVLALPSAGFNNIGWAKQRTGAGLMSTEDFEDLLVWYRDTYLGANGGMLGAKTGVETWKKKLVTFDCWNEYGEGHYMMPTIGKYKDMQYGGFGYLDAISKVFGNETDPEGNNDVPKGKGKLRLGTLYPSYDQYIRREMLVDVEEAESLKHVRGYDAFTSVSPVTSYSGLATQCNSSSGSHSHSASCYRTYDSTEKAIKIVATSSCSSSSPARLKFESSEYLDLDMSTVDYIHIKVKGSKGGTNGKLYFRNTNMPQTDNNDTKVYRYNEQHLFYFNTYEGVYDYYFDVNAASTNWEGTLDGIMLELSHMPDEEIYLYSLELLAIDDSKKKTEITVDSTPYAPRDYAEIEPPFADTGVDYTTTKNELYIAPADEQGLFRQLHIVREWHRPDERRNEVGTLYLETPDGTTFKFVVGSDKVILNGSKTVTLPKKVALYDGVPVLPLIYILETAGYDYMYDFLGKKLDVVVAQKYRLVEGIENGNAEDTTNVTAFTSHNNAVSDLVTIEDDPDGSDNKVWKRSTSAGEQYNYFSTPFDFEAGRTYTLDFDIYFDSVGTEGAAPSGKANIAVSPRYDEGSGVKDHKVNVGKLAHKTWTHISHTFTVSDSCVADSGQMSIYTDPLDSLGCVYYVDNFVLRTTANSNILENGDAEGENETAFRPHSSESGDTVTVETEEDGNKYWSVNSTAGNGYTYVVQDVQLERGVTYYYKVRVKLGNNAVGEAISKSIINLNVRYYDAFLLGESGEWYQHTQNLKDKDGNTVYFNSGDDWVDCYGSFTVSMGFDPDNTSVNQQITFYCNPQQSTSTGTNVGTDYMFDDFQISTEGPIA